MIVVAVPGWLVAGWEAVAVKEVAARAVKAVLGWVVMARVVLRVVAAVVEAVAGWSVKVRAVTAKVEIGMGMAVVAGVMVVAVSVGSVVTGTEAGEAWVVAGLVVAWEGMVRVVVATGVSVVVVVME